MNEENEQEYKSIVYVDIDETICWTPDDRNYTMAVPMEDHIKTINELYQTGHKIVYWTARGTTTSIDWRNVTEQQFERWGVLYHELKFNKPNYNIFIDDKNVSSARFFNPKESMTFRGRQINMLQTNKQTTQENKNEPNEII